MTTKMHDMLIDEIAFIFDCLEYEDISNLETIDTIEEAKAQTEEYDRCFCGDIPEGLNDPEIMMMVWNYCLNEKKKADVIKLDDEIAAEHPDHLRFRDAYDDGSSAFFDLEMFEDDLIRRGYDKNHRNIVLAALKAACTNQ